jgi:predicted DNA-binding transcriptional regulator AlpA
MTHHLVGAAEVAGLLGVSRQRVDQLAGGYADFPQPEAELAAGRVWSREAIDGWLATHPERKPGREGGRTIMFERLTDRAREAFVLAQGEARAFGHSYVGCEHLVLGLAGQPDGVAGRTFAALGLTPAAARTVLGRLVGRGSGKAEGHLPFTPRVRRALELAEQASVELGHDFTGTEHLLLGILREGENVGCRLLIEAGLEPVTVRLKTLELMGFPQPKRSSPTGDWLDQLTERLASIDARLASLEQGLA